MGGVAGAAAAAATTPLDVVKTVRGGWGAGWVLLLLPCRGRGQPACGRHVCGHRRGPGTRSPACWLADLRLPRACRARCARCAARRS